MIATFALSFNSRLKIVVALLGFALLLFLPGLGASPLLDRDEPAYAETAREMLQRGDWIATWFNGEPRFDKPPLVYWGEMAAFSLLGVNETAARLPVVLFGLAGVLATYWVGLRLGKPKAGLLAGFILASSMLYFGLARSVLLDVPFTFCFTLAMGTMIAGLQEPTRTRWPLLAGAALGLAILAKTPAAVILFGAILVCTGLWRRDKLRLRGLRWGYAIITCLLIAAPWYIAMTLRFGGKFLTEFLLAGNMGRFLQAEHTRSALPYYYLPVILVGFLPWTALLPGALRTAWRERRESLVLLLWVILTLLFFSASQSKLPGYILPIFPALALLVALDWESPKAAANRRGPYWAIGFTLLIAALGFAYAYRQAPQYLSAAILIAILGLLPLGLVFWQKNQRFLSLARTAVLALCASLLLGYGLLPTMGKEHSAKALGLKIQAENPTIVYLFAIKPIYLPSLLFYAQRPVTAIMKAELLQALQPGDLIVIEAHKARRWALAENNELLLNSGKLSLWRVKGRHQQ
jgi:4-amino-4-deoxy-L-arabinose transferase-like glycosyltransferase